MYFERRIKVIYYSKQVIQYRQCSPWNLLPEWITVKCCIFFRRVHCVSKIWMRLQQILISFLHMGMPAKTYLHQICVNTRCSQEDLQGVMEDRDGWRERESQGTLCCQYNLMIMMLTMIHIIISNTITLRVNE